MMGKIKMRLLYYEQWYILWSSKWCVVEIEKENPYEVKHGHGPRVMYCPCKILSWDLKNDEQNDWDRQNKEQFSNSWEQEL